MDVRAALPWRGIKAINLSRAILGRWLHGLGVLRVRGM
jgi:hypothetical protein